MKSSRVHYVAVQQGRIIATYYYLDIILLVAKEHAEQGESVRVQRVETIYDTSDATVCDTLILTDTGRFRCPLNEGHPGECHQGKITT